MDQPKLQPTNDAEWRKYYETKCRTQRKDIAKLTELCRRARGVIEMYLGGMRPNADAVLELSNELELDPRMQAMYAEHAKECERLFNTCPAD